MSLVTVTHRLTRRQTAALAEGDLSLESLTARAQRVADRERDTVLVVTSASRWLATLPPAPRPR